MKLFNRQKEKLSLGICMMLLAAGLTGCGKEKLQYIERIEIEDYYGDHSLYEVYAPIGNENENGSAFYFEHGLGYSASIFKCFDSSTSLETIMTLCAEYGLAAWQENEIYSDIEISDVLKNGDDSFQILRAKKEDYYGTVYDITEIYYMDMMGKDVGVLWNMEMEERDADEVTNLIIDELARCYKINLDDLKVSSN